MIPSPQQNSMNETGTIRYRPTRRRSVRPHPAARLLDEAGPTVSLAEAAQVLGISYNTASAAVSRGELGVRTLRFGRRWRVPTADLRRLVGLDPTLTSAADTAGGVA